MKHSCLSYRKNAPIPNYTNISLPPSLLPSHRARPPPSRVASGAPRRNHFCRCSSSCFPESLNRVCLEGINETYNEVCPTDKPTISSHVGAGVMCLREEPPAK